MFKYRDEPWYDDKCFPPKVIKKKLKKIKKKRRVDMSSTQIN